MRNGENKLLSIFAEQRDALMRFLTRRLGDATLAEDLTQETWLRAANMSGTAAVANPRSYLFRIASNLAIDHRRHSGLAIEVAVAEELVTVVPDPAPSPEAVSLHRSELARLLRAVDSLPPRCREVFLLVKVHELSYAEVAARLGISKNTVMVQMVNALARLDSAGAPEADRDDGPSGI